MKENKQFLSIEKANFLQSVEDYELEIEIQEQKNNHTKRHPNADRSIASRSAGLFLPAIKSSRIAGV